MNAPLVHALLVTADNLDAVVEAAPPDCLASSLTLTMLSTALQLTATQLQAEARERENRLEGVG